MKHCATYNSSIAGYYDVTSRFLLLDFACRGMPLALGPAFIYQKDLLLHHRLLADE